MHSEFQNLHVGCIFYFLQFNFDQMQIWMHWCISSRNWWREEATLQQQQQQRAQKKYARHALCLRSIVLFACVPRAPSIDVGPIVIFSPLHLCSSESNGPGAHRLHTCITENSSPRCVLKWATKWKQILHRQSVIIRSCRPLATAAAAQFDPTGMHILRGIHRFGRWCWCAALPANSSFAATYSDANLFRMPGTQWRSNDHRWWWWRSSIAHAPVNVIRWGTGTGVCETLT